jgi:DNA-binding transcriptional ArsR family regulator
MPIACQAGQASRVSKNCLDWPVQLGEPSPVAAETGTSRSASGFRGTLPSGTFYAIGVRKWRLVMEMHQVRYFLAVADELNFSRAARRCDVSQPTLSRAIKSLEAELGGDLFRREGKNTHLSELGQMVRPHLEMVFDASANAKRVSQDLIEMKRAPLNSES